MPPSGARHERTPGSSGSVAPAAGASTGTPVLEVRGVTKAYGDRQVLAGIDLAVQEHQAVALIGASGSGKSTLLRCIDLLDDIDDGDVLVDGEVLTDPSVDPVAARRRLAMVFQGYNLFPHLSVLENVVLGPVRAQGVGRKEAEERARTLLDRFGLGGRERDHRIGSRVASSNASRSCARSRVSRAPCCSTR